MSFLVNIKRALGFDGDITDEDDPLYEDTAESIEEEAPASKGLPPSAAASPEQKPIEFDAAMQDAIFEKIVAVFNASLPEFLAKSVDPELERKNLYDALDTGVKDYLKGISKKAEAYCDAQWQAKQASMAAELEALKTRAGEIEKQSSEVKQRQLSADRQKRALSDRVHDLEATVAKLESEREQYELENRSLVNRIKVANVQQEDLEKSQAEIQELRLQLNKMRQNPEIANSEEVAELQQLRADLSAKLEDANVLLEKKDNEIKDLNKTIAEFNTVMGRLEELDKTLTSQQHKIKAQKKALAEKDSLIAEKDSAIAEKDSSIADKDSEISALKAGYETLLDQKAKREEELLKEIQTLRPPTVVAEMQVDFDPVAEESAPRISEDDLSAMEETFESGEWFTNTPPPETPSMRLPESESEFGYHAPRRKNTPPTHPDQLSLF